MAELPEDLCGVKAAMFDLLDLLPRLWHAPNLIIDTLDPGCVHLVQSANDLPAALSRAAEVYAPIEDEVLRFGEVISLGRHAGTPCSAALTAGKFLNDLILMFANRDQMQEPLDPWSEEFASYVSRINAGKGLPLDLGCGPQLRDWMSDIVPVSWLDAKKGKAAVEQQLLRVAVGRQQAPSQRKSAGTAAFSHGDDFRSAIWFGQPYSFTANQAAVVRVLWEHWERGTSDVGDETLLSAVDPEAPPARLNVLFRDHPAWGTMIVEGATRGSHRLSSARENHHSARA